MPTVLMDSVEQCPPGKECLQGEQFLPSKQSVFLQIAEIRNRDNLNCIPLAYLLE